MADRRTARTAPRRGLPPAPAGGAGRGPTAGDGPERPGRWRLLAFALVVVLCAGGLTAYLLVQRHGAASAEAEEAVRTRLAVDDVLAVPHLVVRNTEPGPSNGKIALVPLSDPAGPRAIVDVSCERVSATAAGAVCLQAVPGLVTTYRAVFLDSRFAETGRQDLPGIPSRARISSGGRYAASTVFVSGHAYTDAQFSTQTVITDLTGPTSLGDLETWRTTGTDGQPVTATDRNFWGVSFIGDGPGFYATMGTGGTRFLVRGDATARTMEVVTADGACPSVSADGSTLVMKALDPVSHNDYFVTYDVATGARARLAEGRQVDDQVTWWGSSRVLYALGAGLSAAGGSDVWVGDLAGGEPALLIPSAASPSVVAPGALDRSGP